MSPPSWSQAAEHNRRAWNALVARGHCFTTPAADDEILALAAAVRGAAPESAWRGRSVLCLGAGGGRHSAVYAAAGATVTVVDISNEMLALDRSVAAERGLNIRAVEASMDDLSMLGRAEFDLVVQPVSTCYVPNVAAVYREVARVTRRGGLYVSQHKQPTSLQTDVRPAAGGGYELVEPYYRSGPLPPVAGSWHREEGTLEFLHRWEELVGELCRVGFVIENLTEPLHANTAAEPGAFGHRSRFAPPYVRLHARRTATAGPGGASGLWTPGG